MLAIEWHIGRKLSLGHRVVRIDFETRKSIRSSVGYVYGLY